MVTEKLVEHAIYLLKSDPDSVRDAKEHPNNSLVGRAMWLTLGKSESGQAYLYEEAVQEALHRLDASNEPKPA
jgi:hypothetical protein